MSSERTQYVVCDDADAVARTAATELAAAVDRARTDARPFFLSLAGGSTPRKLYETLARDPFRTGVDWARVHLFWGDERCVPPTDPDSNYRMVRESLLAHVPIPAAQVHRVRGEDPPDREAARYEAQIARVVPAGANGVPRFDWMLLGVGEDGHTASLFPGQALVPTGQLCGVARHPVTGVLRVSLTHELIVAAETIAFLVTGGGKASVVRAIRTAAPEAKPWPAAAVSARGRGVTWFVDRAAAG